MQKREKQVFRVCGRRCGQSRFLTQFRDPAKSSKRPRFKAFLASAVAIVDS